MTGGALEPEQLSLSQAVVVVQSGEVGQLLPLLVPGQEDAWHPHGGAESRNIKRCNNKPDTDRLNRSSQGVYWSLVTGLNIQYKTLKLQNIKDYFKNIFFLPGIVHDKKVENSIAVHLN